MFKFEKLQAMFNCKVCHNLLREPVSLPCGQTVCKAHSEELCKSKCDFCTLKHQLSKNGFSINKLIQDMLEIQLNTLNIDINQFNDCKQLIRDLKASISGYESIQNDPASFISEHFIEMNRLVDLRRETLILEIQQSSDKLIEEIANAKRECLKVAKSRTVTTKNFDACKLKYAELHNGFDSFEINGKRYEEIVIKCNELKVKMDPMIGDFKKELLRNTPIELVYNDVRIEDTFGSLLLGSVGVRYF